MIEGFTQVILLSGDAGCGMSALSHQLSRRLSRQDINTLELPDVPAQSSPTLIDGIVEALGLPPQIMTGQKSQIEAIYRATFKLRQIQVTVVNDVQSYMSRPYRNASPAVTRIASFIASGISKFVFLCTTTQCGDVLAEGLQNEGVLYVRIQVERMPFGPSYTEFVHDTVKHLTGHSELPESLPLELHELADGLVGVTMQHIRCLIGPRTALTDPSVALRQTGFENFCTPICDETFSSWLMRNTFNKRVWSLTGKELDACRQAAKMIGGGDVDRASELVAAGKVLPQLLPIGNLAATFRLGDTRVFPRHYLLTYCPQCLADDVACGRLPSWRKQWRQYGYCICDKHEIPVILSVLQHPRPDPFFRAWDAFCEYVQSPFFRLKRRLVSGTASAERLMIQERKLGLLILRVQRWMIKQVLKGHFSDLSPSGARFLLNVLLHEPIPKRSQGGFARAYFDSRDLIHVFYACDRGLGDIHGFYLSASPRQTLTAYLLIGIAYGVVSQAEATFLQSVMGAGRADFPTCRSEISFAATTMFLSEHWAGIKYAAQRDLCFYDLRQVGWIFSYEPDHR
ncbi:hypothetical protein [Pseudomonas sp. B26(2017)]|uniref:hypothetical protein n=1 Tax=Pseudomonas sp. B26(2017) TaxID=1981732 RepID=UPI000A1F916E|nr:hypothetical protein [Pseudomonas sp. B26(2017)]